MFFQNHFAFLRACFIAGRRPPPKETESPPYNNRAEIGFVNCDCDCALGVLERRDPGANVGAFPGNMPVPPRAPGGGARFTPGVSYNQNYG